MENADQQRIEQGQKLAAFLNRIGAYDFFQQLKSDPQEASKVSFEEFKSFLDRINGIARGLPVRERHSDGETVQIGGMTGVSKMPRHSDKESILNSAFEAAKNLTNRNDAGYLLPVIVNAVHLYADGNGRTSRTLHMLLRTHESKEAFEKEIGKALGKYGRYDAFNLDPNKVNLDIEKIMFIKYGFKFSDDTSWSPMFPDGYYDLLSIEEPQIARAKEFYDLSRADRAYCFIAARDYLTSKGLLDNAVTMRDGGKMISLVKMETILSDDNWDKIFDAYYGLKKEHVETLIQAFVEPDKYKTIDGTATVRDEFIKEVEKEYAENNK